MIEFFLSLETIFGFLLFLFYNSGRCFSEGMGGNGDSGCFDGIPAVFLCKLLYIVLHEFANIIRVVLVYYEIEIYVLDNEVVVM